MRVLVLGGTEEGAALATALHGRAAISATSSLAGRVDLPSLPPGEVRIGAFGDPQDLAGWLRSHATTAVVDATHPFAAVITAHAVAATGATGVRLLVLRRPGWVEGRGDRWHRVPDPAAAAALLPTLGRRVFLALGRPQLPAFAALSGTWFLIRTAERPGPPLPAQHRLMVRSGPYTADAERALLREHRIDVLVCRDSGGEMTAAKLVAARELGLPVVLLDRPPAPQVPTVETVDAALDWLDRLAVGPGR